MRIWILLPAFNEEKSLPSILGKISASFNKLGLAYNVVIVNDGSIDGTLRVIDSFSRKMSIDVVTHPINRGLGETERDGFEFIAGRCADDDIIIRMDCDDTHESKYFDPMIRKIGEGYDVVIATRFLPGGSQIGVNTYRAFISYCANVFMKLLFNIKGVTDYSCGFRAYRAATIKFAIALFGNCFIQLKGLGFTSTLEMIVKLNLLGCRFGEVPFVLRYDQKAGPSKMITNVTTLGYLVMVVLYYWPFGGWFFFYRGVAKLRRIFPDRALEQFGYRSKKRGMMCRIGG
jgi:dolichol-phosphate mannosyltransferase